MLKHEGKGGLSKLAKKDEKLFLSMIGGSSYSMQALLYTLSQCNPKKYSTNVLDATKQDMPLIA
ncbi:MAG: hypothetical protein AAF770_03590 [Bacteroidota bacterium]